MKIKIVKEIGRNPNVDWLLILFFCTVIIIVLAFLDYSLYNAVTTGQIQGEADTAVAATPELDDAAITKVITRFGAKEEISKKAKAGYTGPVDPSI
jgi:hypothetical protein